MSSPFSTIEEFNGAMDGPTEGAIYTFAHSPAINMIALLVAVGIFVWFLVATYTTHPDDKPSAVDKSINHLSSFIIIGLLSLVAADYRQSARPEHGDRSVSQTAVHSARQTAPLGLLGMVSISWPAALHRARRKKSRKEMRHNFYGHRRQR
ncbi:MAG: hypothetical protein AAF703_11960 [Cyanobacteria bacterium P01_D01_bin.105]